MSPHPGGGSRLGPPRRPDIQGLRGLAVLLVVVFHAGLPVPGGFTGVDVFFAISGFVITAMLLKDLTGTDRINLRRFYVRRIKRLGPALAVMVVTIAALGTVASPVSTQLVGAKTGLFASLFSANAFLVKAHTGYFDPAATFNPFLHTWTLAVEEQFYLFFPALLLVSWRLGRRSRFLRGSGRWPAVVAVSLTTAVSFLLALTFSGSLNSYEQQFSFYGSPTRAWEFGAGALLALLTPWLTRMARPHAQVLGALGLAAIGAGAFAIHDPGGFRVMSTLLPVFGACALLAAGTAGGGGVTARMLSVRPAVWIGDLSYSWYLWHWPLIVFAAALWPGTGWAAPTLAAVSLVPAWLSYRFVENPIRFSPRIHGRTVFSLAAICVAVPIGACLGLMETTRVLAGQQTMKSYERSQIRHVDLLRGCDNPTPLGQRTAGACTWRVPRPRGQVVLIGDSNAGHFSEAVIRAANRAGFELTIATFSACPFIDLKVTKPPYSMAACRHFYAGSLEALVRRRPSLVIDANRADLYIRSATAGLGRPGGETTSHSEVAKSHLWSQGLASSLRRLNNAGIPVVVVQQVPIQPFVGGCAVIRILTQSCTRSVARSTVERDRRLAVAAETRAVATAPTTWRLDFINKLCGRDRCTNVRGTTLLYRDRYHLSVDGGLTLTSEFYRAIRAHARPRDTPNASEQAMSVPASERTTLRPNPSSGTRTHAATK